MKKACTILIVSFLILFDAAAIAASDQQVQKIRKLYQDAITDTRPYYHTITLRSMLPAVGLQTTTIQFRYSSMQAEPEGGDPYRMEYSLHMVTVDYNIAARIRHHFEYLYDEREKIVFHYHRVSGSVKAERRYYFHGERLIKAIVNAHDDNGSPEKYTRTSTFSQSDVNSAKRILRNATEYQEMFRQLLRVERVDK